MGRFTEIAKKSAAQIKLGILLTSRRRKGTPHRIKFRGEFLTTKSGKTVWPSLGAAKLAMRNEFNTSRIFKESRYSYNGYQITTHCGEIINLSWAEKDDLEAAIYVALLEETEFVPVSPDDFFKSGKL